METHGEFFKELLRLYKTPFKGRELNNFPIYE
jgi:hypothetical protein